MDPYISMFLQRDMWQLLNTFFLGLARIVPIIAIAPFLGAKAISDPMKIGFGVGITFIFFPFLLVQAEVPQVFNVTFIALVIKEVTIGAVLGMIIAIPFFYTQGAGSLIDHQRGAQSLQVMDPTTQTQSSPIGRLYGDIMLVSFFYIGGPLLFFDALFTSYQIMPIDKFLPPEFFTDANPVWHTLISLCHTLFKLAIQLAAPSLIAILMSDLFLGIANRMAPQVQISFLLWSMKAFIGLAILWLAWWLIIKQMDVHGLNWLKNLETLIDKIPPVAQI